MVTVTFSCSSVTVTNVYHPPVRAGDQGDLGVCALRIPQSNFVIGAHDPFWGDSQPPDRLGRYPEEWAGDNDLVCLNKGEPTRFNGATGGSALDISMVHASLLHGAEW